MQKFWMVKWATLSVDTPIGRNPDKSVDEKRGDQSRSTHVEHSTLEGAMVEANRLARSFPQRTFVVLEAIKVVKAEIETVAKEWIGDRLFLDSRDYGRDLQDEPEPEPEPDCAGPDSVPMEPRISGEDHRD